MGNWDSVNFSDFVPQPLTASISAITHIVDEFLALYRQALNLAKAYEASFSSDSDLLGVLVQAVVDLFEGLLQAGKAHVLFVPMQKQTPSPQNQFPRSLEDMAINLGLSFDETAAILKSGSNQDYASLMQTRGGNQGFYRTVVESLLDLYDPNRPQYLSASDYIACTVLMVGAPTFLELVQVATAFNRVFRPDGDADLTARLIPIPTDLKLKVIALPTTTKFGVRLDWSVPKPTFDSPYFPRVSFSVAEYAVIRSTNHKVTSAKSVLDFFGTQNLTPDLTSSDSAKASRVLAIGSGTTSSYVDDDQTLDSRTAYYYCVAWRVKVSENGEAKTLDWDLVSAVQKTRVRTASGTSNGKPPDWVAYGSMLDIMPDVAITLRTALEQVKKIGDRNGGVSVSLKSSVAILQENADEFAGRLDELNARLKRLSAIFSKALPGIYHTQFAGKGGNMYLMSELASRLNDKSDPKRPPYDANEYVVGVVIVGGGPRLPDVKPLIDLMQHLFATPNASNAVVGVLNAIDTVVTAQEQRQFSPAMHALPSGSPPPTNPALGTTFASDGTSISSNDARNPEVGVTGKLDPTIDPC